MKKKLCISSIIIITFLIICLIHYNYDYKNIIINKTSIDNKNSLSMMIETNYNSGLYEESKDNVWPSDGFEFNSSLSKCENGSTLTWDNVTKKVIMNGNIGDKCYVYFDKEPTPFEILQAKIYAANPGDTIILTENIVATKKPLIIDKEIVLDGNGKTLSGKSTINSILDIRTTNKVKIKYLTIIAENDSTYGINAISNDLMIQNSVIKSASRGINFVPINSNSQLKLAETEILNTKITDYDNDGPETFTHSRGLSLGNLSSATINLDHVNIYGYNIAINNTSSIVDSNGNRDAKNSYINAENSNFKGTITLNNWMSNIKYKFNDCIVKSINSLKEPLPYHMVYAIIQNNAKPGLPITMDFTAVTFSIFNKSSNSQTAYFNIPENYNTFSLNFFEDNDLLIYNKFLYISPNIGSISGFIKGNIKIDDNLVKEWFNNIDFSGVENGIENGFSISEERYSLDTALVSFGTDSNV